MTTRTGYMDYVDFLYELGEARGGNTIYPSIKNIKEYVSCVDECGIVEVEVKLVKVVQGSDYSGRDVLTKEKRIKHLKTMIEKTEERKVWYENRLQQVLGE